MKPEVVNALKVLFEQESIDDYVYLVRENEGLGWEGPRVVAYSEACRVLQEVLKDSRVLKEFWE